MSNMFLNIVSTFKNDGIASATRQLGAFGSQAASLGSTLGRVGAALASFGVAAKAVQFTSQSIDSARDLERNMYSLQTIFDEFTPTMEKFVEGAYNIGLSQKDAAKASTFLGSVLKQSGFSMEDVTEQTQKLVSLGVDLAATYGYDVQEALLGMTALFRGEYDPIEKFGVAMKQSEINSELAARGLNNLEGAARRNAEQVIRMELLYQRAADATGAFTGQSGNLFVEQKKLQAQFENLQASIGSQLLPVMGALIEALVPLIEYLGPLISQAVESSLPVFESIVGFIADLSDKSTLAGGSLDFLIGAVKATADATSGLMQDIGPLILLIGGVTAGVYLLGAALTFINAHPVVATLTALAGIFILINETNKNLQFQTDKTGASITSFNGALEQSAATTQYVTDKYGNFPLVLAETSDEAKRLSGEISAADRARLNNLKDQIMGVKISAGEATSELRRMRIMAGVKDVVTTGTGTGAGSKAGTASAKQEQALREMIAAQEQAARELAAAQEAARRAEEERLQKRSDAYKSFADSVKATFGGIKQSILSSFSLPDLGNSVNSITRNIKKLLQQTKDFARNITSLSQQGLTNDLLQQVIAAGPMGGGRLAQALAGAGGGFIGELNQAYGEFGGIASGIAGVGTTAAFGNQEVVNNYYNIEVSGGVGSGPSIGKAIVDAIKSYERTSGAVWQGA
jgi:hypothetical protein